MKTFTSCVLLTLASSTSAIPATSKTGVEILNHHDKPIYVAQSGGGPPREVLPGNTTIYAPGEGLQAFVSEHEHRDTGGDSQIEWTIFPDRNVYDVSHVTGYTMPIVCGCQLGGSSAPVTYAVGCNLDLLSINDCPAEYDTGISCLNPMRGKKGTDVKPTPFFAPCEKAAFTYPDDGTATDNNRECVDASKIICCVGKNCPRSVRQKQHHGEDNEDTEPPEKQPRPPKNPKHSQPPKKQLPIPTVWCTRGEKICESLFHCTSGDDSCGDDGYCDEGDRACEVGWDQKKSQYAHEQGHGQTDSCSK